MEKINVAELLKDCPKGMELDCTIWDNVVFDHIDMKSDYPIHIKKMGGEEYLTEEGCFNFDLGAKCVIFPKGKTTWEGFAPYCKFKNGDIMAVENDWGIHIFIYNHSTDEYDGYGYYAILTSIGNFKINSFCSGKTYRLATEEEKEKLFNAIRTNGYKWNPGPKTLEKLIEPKFKVGDTITNGDITSVIKQITKDSYILDIKDDKICFNYVFFSDQDKWELVSNIEPEFKEGDIVISDKGDIHLLRTKDSSYCAYRERWEGLSKLDKTITTSIKVVRFAFEKEKAKLFQVIKDNGYRWNPETKTLEKLVETKFKVGDVIVDIYKKHLNCDSGSGKISQIIDDKYIFTDGSYLHIQNQDNWELVPNKFDINTLVPFESRVLIRDGELQKWSPAIWGFYDSEALDYQYKLVGVIARYCIPFEGNEYLLGTSNDCDEFYRTWKN